MADKIGLQTELELLSALERREVVTQPALAKRLSISVGMVNALLKRAVRKGLVKAKAAPYKRWAYYLTPEGFEEKSRLVARYLDSSLTFFRMARREYRLLFLGGQRAGFRRFVLVGRLSNTLDAGFCTDALDEALAQHGAPEVFNTDQSSQFTSFAFIGRLQAADIRVSMDGRGRCMDNIFIERLWRSLKYKAIYLHELADGSTARRLMGEWVRFYNVERPQSALGGATPAEAYRGGPPVDMMDKPLRALPTSPQAQQQQQEDRFKGILPA